MISTQNIFGRWSLCEIGGVESIEVACLIVGDQEPVVSLVLLHLGTNI